MSTETCLYHFVKKHYETKRLCLKKYQSTHPKVDDLSGIGWWNIWYFHFFCASTSVSNLEFTGNVISDIDVSLLSKFLYSQHITRNINKGLNPDVITYWWHVERQSVAFRLPRWCSCRMSLSPIRMYTFLANNHFIGPDFINQRLWIFIMDLRFQYKNLQLTRILSSIQLVIFSHPTSLSGPVSPTSGYNFLSTRDIKILYMILHYLYSDK